MPNQVPPKLPKPTPNNRQIAEQKHDSHCIGIVVSETLTLSPGICLEPMSSYRKTVEYIISTRSLTDNYNSNQRSTG